MVIDVVRSVAPASPRERLSAVAVATIAVPVANGASLLGIATGVVDVGVRLPLLVVAAGTASITAAIAGHGLRQHPAADADADADADDAPQRRTTTLTTDDLADFIAAW